MAGRSAGPAVRQAVAMVRVDMDQVAMARQDQAAVQTRPARPQARMADTLAAQAVRGQRVARRALMVATAAHMAVRMAAPQRPRQARPLQA